MSSKAQHAKAIWIAVTWAERLFVELCRVQDVCIDLSGQCIVVVHTERNVAGLCRAQAGRLHWSQ